MDILDWYAKTCNGAIISGKKSGSFASIKQQGIRTAELWVQFNGLQIFAHKVHGQIPLGHDFFVSKAVDANGNITPICYKLITYYQNAKFTKKVFSNGSYEIETSN